MEVLGVLLGLLVLAAVLLVLPILTLVSFFRTRGLQEEVQKLGQDVKALEGRLAAALRTGLVEASAAPGPGPVVSPGRAAASNVVPPFPDETPPPSPPPVPSRVTAPLPASAQPTSTETAYSAAPPSASSVGPEASAPAARHASRAPRPPSTATPTGTTGGPSGVVSASDLSINLASNLGPKIMVGVGALFLIVTLGLLVKYAWDNEWVGPTGRILFGATVSVGLIALGTRIMGREYRPLGQALAATGIAGLYVSAFGAHGFYDLIPRGAAGFLMVVITACAVLLAVRLDARLLAGLAWVGGYLTPVLLSTGEDRALSLFLYLLLLDAGALILDHRKPWSETMPLAVGGTLVLYGGWYARFMSPANFLTAAFGLILFTALFAFGMARKERSQGLAVVFGLAALGVTALASTVGGRSDVVAALSLGLAALALWNARQSGPALSAVAGMALLLPYLAWAGVHRQDLTFGMGAGWLVAGTLLYVLAASRDKYAVPLPLEALALVVSGFLTIAMATVPQSPLPLLGLLLAQGGISILARQRWAAAEPTALAAAALSVLGSFDRFFEPEQPNAILALALPVFALYLLAQVVRGFRNRASGAVDHAALLTQLGNALFLWTVLYRVLYATNPGALGFASVALAILYLLLGLALLRVAPASVLEVRTYLGLAACFLTVAIPVQLGLHGITFAWAAEALVLLGLGVRFGSALTRLGAYGVLGLAVLRLFARHLPLHAGPFVPVLNASFAIWIAVIACVGFALVVTRKPRREGEALDVTLAPILSVAAVLLLFGVLTGETAEAFAQIERGAIQAGDAAAARSARLMGGLSLSVLWSLFATAMLAAGLGLRSRALFYAAYGLFALTAGKVVLVDLATLQTIYRILSFLAMGVLLMAGAYLAIRFRERLESPREAS